MKRVRNFILDIWLNGIVLYGIFLLTSYAFYQFSPTFLYFRYTSIEPVTEPALISDEYILMRSTLKVNLDGNLYWNDVLRCRDNRGNFTYFSQYDTNAQVVYRGDTKTSEWYYRGDKPAYPAECVVTSTITRKLPFGIEKHQHITSKVFAIR